MKTYSRYIYAGARLKARENENLNETQADKLISAPDINLAWQALDDTFIGPYLDQESSSKPDGHILKKSLDQSIIDTKKTLITISPDPDLLEILWVKYDFHNLRVILRGHAVGMSLEKMEGLSSSLGTYEFKKLKKIYDDRRLALLDPYLQKAVLATENFTDASTIGLAVNKFYFDKIKFMASQSKYEFIKTFVALLIDTFNLQTALREKTIRKNGQSESSFIIGGRFSPKDLETEDLILNQFPKLGGETLWQEALNHYQETGHHTLIRKTAENYINSFLEAESKLGFTPAKLFYYFNARKRDIQAIQIIINGKMAGLKEGEIRESLRQLPN